MSKQEEPYKGGAEGRWYFWDGGFLAVGRSRGVIPVHSHHAYQMVVAIEGVGRLREGDDQEWRHYEAAIVDADAPHAFDASGVLGCLLLVDPETREGRALRQTLKQPITPLSPSRLAATREAVLRFWEDPPDEAGTVAFVEFIVRQFTAGPLPHVSLDARVARALQQIQAMEASRLSLDEIASKVFLSPSRFAHLFSEEVGIPFRRYLLWRRITRAMVFVSRGQSLSRAAHAAGFADSAHFTRTFSQMFGIPPSVMLGSGDLYEIPAPFQLAAKAS